MNDYLYDIETEESAEEPLRQSNFSVYVIRFIAFFMLIVLIIGLFRNFQKGADIRIVEIADHITRFQIDNVDISVRPAFSSQREGEDHYYFDVKAPINLPVEGGECIKILVEAQGYHKWENTFCPAVAEKIYIEINLVPENLPPIREKLFET
jgi:hypothetical protein